MKARYILGAMVAAALGAVAQQPAGQGADPVRPTPIITVAGGAYDHLINPAVQLNINDGFVYGSGAAPSRPAAALTDSVPVRPVGAVYPNYPRNIKYSYTRGDSVVRVTWDPVTKDDDGDALDDLSKLDYRVYFVKDGKTYTPEGQSTKYYYTSDCYLDFPATDSENQLHYIGVTIQARYLDGSTYRYSDDEDGEGDLFWYGEPRVPFTWSFTTSAYNPVTALNLNGDSYTFNKWTSGYGVYVQSVSKAKDDWMIVYGLGMDANRYYTISFEAACGVSGTTETFAAYMGTDQTAEAMTVEIVPSTSITNYRMKEYQTFTGTFQPTADGVYYFGIHATSAAALGTSSLYIRNLSIDAGLEPAAPAAGTDMTVTPKMEDDLLSATVTIMAPSKAIDGSDLTELLCAKLFRDGAMVDSVACSLRSPVTLNDANVPAEGRYEYVVRFYNAAGEGIPASVNRFVGVPVPAPVESFSFVDADMEGEVTFSWSEAVKDADGFPMDPKYVTYDIYDVTTSTPTLMFSDITGTTFTGRVVGKGVQKFAQFTIYPKTRNGSSSEGTTSNFGPVGTPYEIPFTEEWSGSEHVWGVEVSSTMTYSVSTTSAIEAPTAPTLDEALFLFRASNSGDYGVLRSGLIYIPADAVTPTLRFYAYGWGSADSNTIAIRVNGTTVATQRQSDYAAGWDLHSIDLSAFKGHVVSCELLCTCITYAWMLFDGFRLDQTFDYDLAAAALRNPGRLCPGQPGQFAVTVSNYGQKTASGYTVSLWSGAAPSHPAVTVAGADLAPLTSAVVTLTDTLPQLGDPVNTYYARVDYDADQRTVNNATPVSTIELQLPNYPTTAVSAEDNHNASVTVTLTEPDLTDPIAGTVVNESFEDYASFTPSSLGYWTTIDADDEPVSGVSSLEFPGLTPGVDKAAFFVLDYDYLVRGQNLTSSYAKPRTGDKSMASICTYSGAAKDDWLVSPRLSGRQQLVSFYARAYNALYRERLELYYSLTDCDSVGSFIATDVAVEPLPGGSYQYYYALLPEGATYFAIRSTSASGFIMLVDDATFEAGPQWAHLDVLGYNIYCDGVLLNDAPLADLTYLHSGVADGEHTYRATVVYDHGESAPSEPFTLETKHSDGLEPGSALASGVRIAVDGNVLTVTGADGIVTVADMQGRTLYRAAGDACLTLPRGIYTVATPERTLKVLLGF